MAETSILTFGCRLNAVQSETIAAQAADSGLNAAVWVNTCAVTAAAVRDAQKAIRRVKRGQPGARVIVTGCAAQTEPQRFAGMAEVDHVVGNREKMRRETFDRLKAGTLPRVLVADAFAAPDLADTVPVSAKRMPRQPRAYVQIQNGCDHRCTFCVIPFGRGASRSRTPDAIVAEIAGLIECGVVEVVLTGVDLTSYRAPSDGAPLGKLVRLILARLPTLPRLRLSSIDGIEADAALITAIADEPRLMPHLHLSLQSGDDMILKRMKRRHSRRDAVAFCDALRRARPGIVFGADLIAGFPTEDDAMFARTLEHAAECGLTYLHVFPYSPRALTPAARMPQLPPLEVKARALRLRELGEARLAAYLAHQCGETVEALVEQAGLGRTAHFAEIALDPALPKGRVVSVRVTGSTGRRLIAAAEANRSAA